MSHAPAHAYFTACTGLWRAPLALDVLDRAALRRSGMGLLDRLSLLLLASWPRWVPRPTLDTSVQVSGDVVEHTTTARWLGIPLQRSVEHFTLAADGARFTVRGGMTGSGEIDASATRGSYRLRWLGVEITQHTERAADRVTVVQEGPGFRGVQVLVRR